VAETIGENKGINILDYSNSFGYSKVMPEPTILQQAVLYFADPTNCLEYGVPRRWSHGVVLCPTCGSDKVKFQPQHDRWQCSSRHSRRQFTLKTGTIMEDWPLGLDKWLPAMWLVASNRNGISSWELHRALASFRRPRGSYCTGYGWRCRTISPAGASLVKSK
jgi:hypothetical protein